MTDGLRKLREMLAPGEEQPWHDHDEKGRPHAPKSFVQIETRDGKKLAMASAFVRWPWVEPEELQGYADDPDPANDVLRWRFAKEPPSSLVLATHVPALLARIDALEAALGPFATFADPFVDAEGWSGPMKQERIVDWFGPSDFRLASTTLAGEKA